MKKVAIYSTLLLLGLVGSQVLPGLLGDAYDSWYFAVRIATMIALSYIMVHVGLEFDIDKSNLKQYGWDYVVAATAAAFPWIFCCAYFVFVLLPQTSWDSWPVWKESLLASRFAAPTSAGVLFSMLAAAGLASTWLFKKARVLAIFDDLDTVLLMIPLKMAMVGLKWQLGVIVVWMAIMLWIAYKFLHRWKIPHTWPWVLGYSIVMVVLIEIVHYSSLMIDANVPIHIEVLLPAFVLGCVIAHRDAPDHHPDHAGQADHAHPPLPPGEERASTIVSAAFMLLVGLSMPSISASLSGGGQAVKEGAKVGGALIAAAPPMGWGSIALHVVLITIVANVGKMFPALCYRREASPRERLAVAVAMWPRGEVGAGVLVISLSYGIGGPVVVIAMLSLALNLVLTGVFIVIVKKLIGFKPAATPA